MTKIYLILVNDCLTGIAYKNYNSARKTLTGLMKMNKDKKKVYSITWIRLES